MAGTDNAAALFKTLGNTTRLQILATISDSEKCVHEIAESIGATTSSVSHHLKRLSEHRVVKRRRDGKHRYYSMDDSHIDTILTAGVAHASE